MRIDEYWLDADQLERLSLQDPTTDFGVELMDKWPSRYVELLSSDTYRGCVVVLLALYEVLREKRPSDIASIEKVIIDADDSLKSSRIFDTMSDDARGGASLTIANAWDGAHSGVMPWQVVAAYESEAIYAARMFCEAQRSGT